MISHSLKFIFVHIPKTSGSSLALFLRNHTPHHISMEGNDLYVRCERSGFEIKHSPLGHYIKHYEDPNTGKSLEDYQKFTIVRNPYDRMMSMYFWKDSKEMFNKEEFIKFVKWCGPGNIYQDQCDYILIDDKIMCDIVYYENLIQDLRNLKCLKNINMDNYPKINVSNNRNYRQYYDDELKELVYNKTKRDFDHFNYVK